MSGEHWQPAPEFLELRNQARRELEPALRAPVRSSTFRSLSSVSHVTFNIDTDSDVEVVAIEPPQQRRRLQLHADESIAVADGVDDALRVAMPGAFHFMHEADGDPRVAMPSFFFYSQPLHPFANTSQVSFKSRPVHPRPLSRASPRTLLC